MRVPRIALATIALGCASASFAYAGPRRAEVEPGLVAVLQGDGLRFEAAPLPREGLLAFAERVCGSRERAPEISAANSGIQTMVMGLRYSLPTGCINPVLRGRGLRALFPNDAVTSMGWMHQVPTAVIGAERETLWEVAEWLTGRGENFSRLREINGLSDESLVPGMTLLIPVELLAPHFAVLLPSQAVARSTVLTGANGATSVLTFSRDSRGDYAGYRLRPGEALYSAVVVRFTGRLFAEDVQPLAEEIASRSDIADVTDIPVGYEVKIPLKYVSPEFLPPGNPNRREYEANLNAAQQYQNEVVARGLSGVTVVLDAGHGGEDVGSASSGVWESLYAYDIMLRVRSVLAERTAAKVYTTTRDGASYLIADRDVLPHSKGHAVLTTPPYPIRESEVSAHLRWYLANSLLRKEAGGSQNDRIVFVSIHADWLHPSVRGSMVYVPGLLPSPSSFAKADPVYLSRQEVREQSRVTFTDKERVRSAGLSRDLAEHLIASFRRADVAIHPNQPVRDRIVRRRGNPWVPAVLRYNKIPVKLLVEVCNLANPDDLSLMKTRSFRQRVAEAIVDGLLEYYDGSSSRG